MINPSTLNPTVTITPLFLCLIESKHCRPHLQFFISKLSPNNVFLCREAEAKANQIANEIESQPSRKARLELENGDEETIYAAVVRPSEPNGKYIPPAKRKGQNSNKAPRTSPPPSSSTQTQTAANNNNNNNASAQTTTSKGAQTSPVPSYAQTPVSNVPHHAPQAAQPPMQAPAQAQTSVPPPAVQNQGHQPRQNHGYRQNGPKGQHMNGESKMMRGPRNVYQTGPPNVPPPVVQQGPPPHAVAYQGADHNNRHREEVKDLQQFSQDFQLGQKDMPPQGPPPQQPPVTEQQVCLLIVLSDSKTCFEKGALNL